MSLSEDGKMEIAHVLFMDIVDYSSARVDQQPGLLQELQDAVRATEEFCRASASQTLLSVPAGDGMALVFFRDPASAVRCAVQVSLALRSRTHLRLRMGIHSGPVYRVRDINEHENVSGSGVNMAERVMDCGDAGHILLSSAYVALLGQVEPWPLQDLGTCATKHDVRLHVFNLCTEEAGNAEVPLRFRSGPVPRPEAAATALAESGDDRWTVRLLGGLTACEPAARGGRRITRFETRHAAALLARLAFAPGRAYTREILAEELWPDEDPEVTRGRFRQALAALRRILEPDGTTPSSVLQADRSQVRLDPAVVRADVVEFEMALAEARRSDGQPTRASCLERAIGLYDGDLLPGHCEEWVLAERERLRDAYVGALLALAGASMEVGDASAAVLHARKAVSLDLLREESHRILMGAYAASGRLGDAVKQYHELERVLKEELNARPSAESRALLESLRGGGEAKWPAERVAPTAVRSDAPKASAALLIGPEPPGGGMSPDSRYYISRPADAAFFEALQRQDSIVLLKGPRQVGKTSLLARGLQQCRATGVRVVRTDFQKLTVGQLESADTLFLTLAEMIADQAELEVAPEIAWNSRRGWNVNFERYLRREVLGRDTGAVVWALDEVDRLFTCPFGSEVFGLFRSWHNERSLDPEGPWGRFTLAIAYATEAHLFITDLNQSPFNVGTRLTLEDFTPEQVMELNDLYGNPIKDASEAARFRSLVGGHPYLVQRGLYEMMKTGVDLTALERGSILEDGIFGDHLRRMGVVFENDDTLRDAIREVLRGGGCTAPRSFYRLRAAGLIAGESPAGAQVRCGIYENYLRQKLTS